MDGKHRHQTHKRRWYLSNGIQLPAAISIHLNIPTWINYLSDSNFGTGFLDLSLDRMASVDSPSLRYFQIWNASVNQTDYVCCSWFFSFLFSLDFICTRTNLSILWRRIASPTSTETSLRCPHCTVSDIKCRPNYSSICVHARARAAGKWVTFPIRIWLWLIKFVFVGQENCLDWARKLSSELSFSLFPPYPPTPTPLPLHPLSLRFDLFILFLSFFFSFLLFKWELSWNRWKGLIGIDLLLFCCFLLLFFLSFSHSFCLSFFLPRLSTRLDAKRGDRYRKKIQTRNWNTHFHEITSASVNQTSWIGCQRNEKLAAESSFIILAF